MKSTFQRSVSAAAVILFSMALIPVLAVAHEEHGDEADSHHFVPKARPPVTAPSAHYSGKTPIDLTNGIFFNIGTYGAPNPDYEKWAESSTWAVSLAERPYNFAQKKKFIQTLDERIGHFETALWNYDRVTEVSKPEGKAHAEKMVTDLKPRIEKARDAWSRAKSAGRGEWDQAQNVAKGAFLELQSFYYSAHSNVR